MATVGVRWASWFYRGKGFGRRRGTQSDEAALREAVRLHGPITAAVDVVINPKKSLLTTRFEDLQT